MDTKVKEQAVVRDLAQSHGVGHAPAVDLSDAYGSRQARFRLGVMVLLALLVLSIVVAVGTGSVRIPARETVSILMSHVGLSRSPHAWPASDDIILVRIRLPRVLAAALVGAALSLAGVLFQGLFRNPMADPYVMGTSGGAALGAAIGILLSVRFSILGFGAVPALAFAGALGTMVLVYRLAKVGGRTPVVTLLLAGFVVSIILGYVMSLMLVINDRFTFGGRIILSWLLGVITVTRWSQVGLISLMVLAGGVAALALARSLNALSLGEEGAAHLGIPVERHKAIIIMTGSLLAAAAVSGAGLVGFVGLIVPHFFRLIFGPDHTRLLPLSAFGGAVFLVGADLLSRLVIAPVELPVGILTALVGGPAFLYLLARSKREYRF